MIKHKKLNRFLCLLLAVVVLFAMPLNTQAHAAVAAPWVMYAIITGLAAMGVTFTCAGGVGAMISAMEEKVAEYQTQTGIQLPIIIIENTSIQPPPEPPSGWNQNKGYFFLTYAGAMALTAFADWLINDGGWGEGETINSNVTNATYTYYVDNVAKVGVTSQGFTEITNNGFFTKYSIDNVGTIMPFYDGMNRDSFHWDWGPGTNWGNGFYFVTSSAEGPSSIIYSAYAYGSKNSSTAIRVEFFRLFVEELYGEISGSPYEHIIGTTLAPYYDAWGTLKVRLFFAMDDGFFYSSTADYSTPVVPTDLVELESTVDIITPAEFAELHPDVDQGILIDTGTTGAETLEELGDLFETVFTDTGTIPQPVPQVITDPATQPVPTPVPTPNPSPEYEDVESLGLPALGDALMDKFPFCLPEDLGRLLNIFTAERQTPKWEVDLYEPLHGRVPMQGDTTLSIDLAEFEEIGQITRWVSVIGFCLFLLVVTKEFITW